jgi:hypothetical protein
MVVSSWFLLAMAEPTYDENLFKWEQAHADVIERKLNSPLTLKSTLQNAGFAEAEIYFSNSSTLQIRIEEMETACQGCHKGRFWRKITVRTSARVRVYPTDAVLPADGFLPSVDVVKTASAWTRKKNKK